MLMEGDPFLLIEGMAIAGLAVGATQGYIYLRSEYPHADRTDAARGHRAARARRGCWARRAARAHLRLEVRVGAGAYICGEETSLLESLEGKRGMVRAKPPLPALRAVRPADGGQQRAHLASVPVILAEGRERLPRLRRGPLARHAAVPARRQRQARRAGREAFGITLRELVEDFGGGTRQRPAGPRGAGRRPARRLPARVAVRRAARLRGVRGEAGAMLGHGGIVVFDDTVDMARMARFAMEFCAIESCGKCTPCRIGSHARRGGDRPHHRRRGPRANLAARDLCEVMTDGSLCAWAA
jgi:formate dehydrogenase iron-sulfur subunit